MQPSTNNDGNESNNIIPQTLAEFKLLSETKHQDTSE